MNLHRTGNYRLFNKEMHCVNISVECLEQHMFASWKQAVLPLTIYCGLTGLFGFLGNIFVLYVHIFKYRRCNFRWFVIGLCLADIFACAVAVPLEMHKQLLFFEQENTYFCKIDVYLNIFTSIELVVLLFSICLDRYRKLLKPHGWQIIGKHVVFIYIFSTFIGLLEGSPIAIIWGTDNVTLRKGNISFTGKTCSLCSEYETGPSYYLALTLLLPNYIALVISLVMYGFIFNRLKTFKKAYSRKDSTRSVVENINIKQESCHLSRKEIDKIIQNSLYADNRRIHASNENISTGSRKQSDNCVSNRKTSGDRVKLPNVLMTSMSTFIFTVVFLLTAILYMFLSNVLLAVQKQDIKEEDFPMIVAVLFGQRLYFLNYGMHPVLFGFLDPNFRRTSRLHDTTRHK